jgi:transposase
MEYFAGLDISMDETHICVFDREGAVVYESKTISTAEAIADELAKAPSCRRIVFETGRMARIPFHGLNQLGLPVVCVESRQAYQAQVAGDPQDRSQRCARAGALGSHWVL